MVEEPVLAELLAVVRGDDHDRAVEEPAPLQVGLTFLQNNDGVTNWGPVMAGTVLTILPVLLLFLVLQRQMIKGLTSGAVKS